MTDPVEVWAAGRRAAGEFPDRPEPRAVAAGAVVELREVTRDTVREICALDVGPGQHRLVAPNAVSLAEAMFAPHAWFRAIYADDVPVGFTMLSLDPEAEEYYLWRLMIAHGRQGRGYGRRALELVAEHVRGLPGGRTLLTSWIPGPGGPEGFYRSLGFELTGERDGDEVGGRLQL